MSIEDTLKAATCRVDYEREQLGSAFWVEDGILVTAKHVIDVAPDDDFTIQTVQGETFNAEVTYRSTDDYRGADLALLETNEEPNEYEQLAIDGDIPLIGTEVVWSGYAQLFGERNIDRQRFGWGRVASESYDQLNGTLFEVDGLFNPSHSGAPVVHQDSGQVIGIVSASAGGFEKMDEEWDEHSKLLRQIFAILEVMDSDTGIFTTVSSEDPQQIFALKSAFDSLNISSEIEHKSGKEISLQFLRDDIPIGISRLQISISKLLRNTAQQTFQMGIGIASGGEPLENIKSKIE